MKEKLELYKYNTMYLIKYTAAAFFYPFFGLYLSSTGKTVAEIGLILMVVPLIAVIFSPLWNYFAKNVNYNKWFMIVFSFVEAIVIFLLLVFMNLYVVIILAGLLSVVSQPFYSMIEGHTTIFTMQTKTSYSKTRLFGSLGYALGVLISGLVIAYTGYNTVLIVSSSLLVVLGFILITLKPLDLTTVEQETKGSIKELFKNKNYLMFFIFYIIVLATLFGGESFWGLYFKSRGIDEKTFGWISFLAYGLEAIFLVALAKVGDKIKLNILMVSIVVVNTLRFLIFALNMPFFMLIMNSVLRAYVMSTLLYIIVRYLGLYIKKHNITLALIIADSAKNIFQAVITQVGGLIIERFNYHLFFYILSGIAILALFFVKYRQEHNDYAIITKEIN